MIVKRRTRGTNGFSKETVVFCWQQSLLSVLAAADVEIDGILADAQRLGTFYNAVFQFEKTLTVEPRNDLLVLVVHGDIGVCHYDTLCLRDRIADEL